MAWDEIKKIIKKFEDELQTELQTKEQQIEKIKINPYQVKLLELAKKNTDKDVVTSSILEKIKQGEQRLVDLQKDPIVGKDRKGGVAVKNIAAALTIFGAVIMFFKKLLTGSWGFFKTRSEEKTEKAANKTREAANVLERIAVKEKGQSTNLPRSMSRI